MLPDNMYGLLLTYSFDISRDTIVTEAAAPRITSVCPTADGTYLSTQQISCKGQSWRSVVQTHQPSESCALAGVLALRWPCCCPHILVSSNDSPAMSASRHLHPSLLLYVFQCWHNLLPLVGPESTISDGSANSTITGVVPPAQLRCDSIRTDFSRVE